MCGFLGYLSFDPDHRPEQSWVQGMLATIAHRGPDDDGVLVDDRCALGFRRLAILDLSLAGHQPMSTAGGRISMVFNGEIYNYIELRRELQSHGHRFTSTGDSEVLLAAYRQWGRACVDHLVGMFAFCIFDRDAGCVFLARDRFGIKPLFFIRTPRGFLCASQLKVIRKSGLWNGALNVARFATFIALNRSEAVPEGMETYLDGVFQVLPGSTCTVYLDGRIEHATYWAPPLEMSRPEGDSVAAYAALFDDAMRLHIRADVPVGVMLSGGMDSVSIACSLASLAGSPETRTQPLHAFSYMSESYDEREQIEDTVRKTGLQLHVLRDLDAERLWSQLDDLIWFHDEPVHSPTVLVGYELYRMAAANGIRVVLSGQGADETSGGYPYLAEHSLVSLALAGRLPSLMTQARYLAEQSGKPLGDVLARCAVMVRGHLLSNMPSYARASAQRQQQHADGIGYVGGDLRALLSPVIISPPGNTLPAELYRASVRSPMPQYLRVEDRNSMAHSVEARVPFLDHRLAEFAMRLPLELKLWDGWNKRVMRQAMEGRIPESVRMRRAKFGFPTAAREWFAGPLVAPIRDVVEGGLAVRSGWLDHGAIKAALARHLSGTSNETNLLFNVAQLESFLRHHESSWQR